MPENTAKIKTEKVRLPEELMSDLRKAAAEYMARGEKAPAQGDLLLHAWKTYKSVSGVNSNKETNFDVTDAPAKTPLPVTFSQEAEPWVSRLVRILQSGHAIAIHAIQSNLIAFEELSCGSAADPDAAATAAHADLDAAIAALRQKTDRAMQNPLRPGAHGSNPKRGKGRDIRRTGTT